MARKKIIDHQELMSATEKILVEKGYDAFHFRLLAEELNVGRSTIYDYYSNKDELISAYLHSFAHERVQESRQVLQLKKADDQLRAFLFIYLKYDHIQQAFTMINQMEAENKETNQEIIRQIRSLISELYHVSLEVIRNAKSEGLIRKEADEKFISYIMLHLIKIPNYRQRNEEERLDELMEFILHGSGPY